MKIKSRDCKNILFYSLLIIGMGFAFFLAFFAVLLWFYNINIPDFSTQRIIIFLLTIIVFIFKRVKKWREGRLECERRIRREQKARQKAKQLEIEAMTRLYISYFKEFQQIKEELDQEEFNK